MLQANGYAYVMEQELNMASLLFQNYVLFSVIQARKSTWNIKKAAYRTSNAQHRTLNAQYRTSNAQRRTSNSECVIEHRIGAFACDIRVGHITVHVM